MKASTLPEVAFREKINNAIDEVVKLVFEDDGDFKQSESPASVMKKIQLLKSLSAKTEKENNIPG